MPRPRVRVYTPIQTELQACWSLGEIEMALRAHEDGDFFASAQLWDLLTRIGRVEGCTAARISALTAKGGGATFRVEPSKTMARDAQAIALAQDVDGWWWSIFPNWVWERILLDYIGMGIAFGTREWFAKDGRWFFRLRPWPLQALRWDAFTERYVVITREGSIPIEPDDPTWWVFEPAGPRSWMRGAVRALGDLGHRRNDALLNWARYCRRHGTPILAIEEPEDAAEGQADTFFKSVANAPTAGGTLRLPKRQTATGSYGYDVRIVEPKAAEAWKTFQAFLEWVSTEIAVRIRGNNLTTEVQGGSLAATSQHADDNKLTTASDGEKLTSFAHRETHLWCTVNVPQHDPARTPWAIWDTCEPEDGEQLGKTMLAIGQGRAAMRTAGMNVNAIEICARARIPLDEAQPLFDLPEPGELVELPPGPEGDDPAPEDAPSDDDERPSKPAKGKKKASARREAARREAAAGTTGGEAPALAPPPGAREGQALIDQRVPDTARALGAALAPDVGDLLAMVVAAPTREALYTAVLRAYEGFDPEDVARALHQVILVAELAGRYSLLQDMAADPPPPEPPAGAPPPAVPALAPRPEG